MIYVAISAQSTTNGLTDGQTELW